MANISLSNITPRHFYEAVKLLKTVSHRFYFSVNTLEIRFEIPFNELKSDTDFRFEQMQHLASFLQELQHSSIPIDLQEFIQTYRICPQPKYFKR